MGIEKLNGFTKELGVNMQINEVSYLTLKKRDGMQSFRDASFLQKLT